jgi:hypothetical protein
MAVVATMTRGTLEALDVFTAGTSDVVLIDLRHYRNTIVAF